MTLLETAIALCEKFQTKVFPVTDKSKPIFKWVNIPEDAPPSKQPSNDPTIIASWCKRHSALAIIAGPELLIVDIDVKEGQNGKASLKFMREQGLSINTFAVKTPSGGLHLYYEAPAHYTAKQDSNITVMFNDADVRDQWHALQEGHESTGVDIRHGNGYVVIPNSVTPKGKYVLLQDDELESIPLDIQIGRSGGVQVSNVTIKNDQFNILGTPINKGHRDQAMLAFTMDIARKNLADDLARVLIAERLKDCDNEDGQAPDIETAWSQYERARHKCDDVVDELILDKVYIEQNQKVISESSGYVCRFEDLRRRLENKQVTLEVTNSTGDVKLKKANPADIWLQDPDRKDVLEIIFDPRFDKGVIHCDRHQGYTEGAYYNQFEPVDLEEKPYTEVGARIFDASIRLMKNVLTKPEDYEWFTKWLGVSIFAPDFRPAWHWHIFGQTRGSGKTTLTKMVRALCGERNCVDLDIDSFEKAFNMELFDCYMGLMNDFTSVSGNTAASQKLNTAFKRITGTDKYIKQAKYIESAQSPIFIRFVFTSNNGRDFPVDEGDRRLYKCESKGIKLESEVLVLAHGIISENASSEIEKRNLHIDITKEDVAYARWMMYEYLRNCGFEEMRNARDCPYNESKDDYIDATKIGYISTIEKYIAHRSFVCGPDIMTEQTIQILLDKIGVKTKVKGVIPELLEHGVLKKIPVKVKKTGKNRTHQIALPMLDYDEDVDEIFMVGADTHRYPCYAIRNFDTWLHPMAIRECKKEQMKLIGVKRLASHRFNPSNAKVVPFPKTAEDDDLLE